MNRISGFTLSMRMKLSLSLSAIAVMLLTSSFIMIMEYSGMSHYVSTLIDENIHSINVAQKLSSVTEAYNLEILSIIGDDEINRLPYFDQKEFVSHCDSLRVRLTSNKGHLADSVMYSYSAYMLCSMELGTVVASDSDTRTWYFDRLQPFFNRLKDDIDALNNATYDDLRRNSATFERGFYRSMIPGVVAVGVGLLLIILLLFFILAYYVNPLYKMLDGLRNYRSLNKKYSFTFEGDDQLKELNDSIQDIADENRELSRRLKFLRENLSHNNSGK